MNALKEVKWREKKLFGDNMIGNGVVNIINILVASALICISAFVWIPKTRRLRFLFYYLPINIILILSISIIENTNFNIIMPLAFIAIIIIRDTGLLVYIFKTMKPSRARDGLLIILPLTTVFYILPYSIFKELVFVTHANLFQGFFLVSIAQMILGHEGGLNSKEETIRSVGIVFFLLGFGVFLVAICYFFQDFIPYIFTIIIILFFLYIAIMYVCFKFSDSGVVKNYTKQISNS